MTTRDWSKERRRTLQAKARQVDAEQEQTDAAVMPHCPECGSRIIYTPVRGTPDGWGWACENTGCRRVLTDEEVIGS